MVWKGIGKEVRDGCTNRQVSIALQCQLIENQIKDEKESLRRSGIGAIEFGMISVPAKWEGKIEWWFQSRGQTLHQKMSYKRSICQQFHSSSLSSLPFWLPESPVVPVYIIHFKQSLKILHTGVLLLLFWFYSKKFHNRK